MRFTRDILKPETRLYLYRCVIAALPLALGLGWITESFIPLAANLALAVFAVGVASGNVNKKEEVPAEKPVEEKVAEPGKETTITVSPEVAAILPEVLELKKSAARHRAEVEDSYNTSHFVD
jgi:hypothetical protein